MVTGSIDFTPAPERQAQRRSWRPEVLPAPTGTRSTWARYQVKHKQVKIHVPGFRNGRIGRVSVICQNGKLKLRWYEGGRGQWEAVEVPEGSDPMAAAITRASEIDERLGRCSSGGGGWRRATIREAVDAFMAWKETCGISAASIRNYRAQFARILHFSENAPEGRHCRTIDRLDGEFCQNFVRWLGAEMTTASGGPATLHNPLRPLSGSEQHETRLRLRSLLQYAMQCVPALVPRYWQNPMSGQLVGRRPRRAVRGLSAPPVTVDELVAVVLQLDEYALALLAPLFCFGPRPSELGRILGADYDPGEGLLKVVCRPSCGYETKGKTDKFLPVTETLLACIQPMIARCRGGPLFIRRRYFRGEKPGLCAADEKIMAGELAARRRDLAAELGRQLSTIEKDTLARQLWTGAGAVNAHGVARELERAAARAGLARTPTSRGVRHLVESLAEEARLSPGVIRQLFGHRPNRGDALFHYSHVSLESLREQVALLDERRRPLIAALARRAAGFRE